MTNASPAFHVCENSELPIHEDLSNMSRLAPELYSSFYVNGIIVIIIYSLILITCIFGMVANGMVIWLLGFCMKRNPFTTYILNLTIADLGVLVTINLNYVFITMFLFTGDFPALGSAIAGYVFSLTYITDQLFLTAISIERCVAVLFPLWHRCHRPPCLPSMVCGFIWLFSFLINGLDFVFAFASQFMLLPFILNVAICTPLMAASTVILFTKICTKSQQRKRGRLITTIFLALFFFLLFGFPMNYVYFLMYYSILGSLDTKSLFANNDFGVPDLNSTVLNAFLCKLEMILFPAVAAVGGAVLNCSVNPVIYFLVGRKKKGRSRLSMKLALQRVFMEEEYCRGHQQPQPETQL